MAHTKTGHTCENILKLEVALWTFVFVEGVEPTNNNAERPLRRAVLWRRRSFGTQSENGSRFVERVLATVTTLRQQERDVLDYLTEACAAAIRGTSPHHCCLLARRDPFNQLNGYKSLSALVSWWFLRTVIVEIASPLWGSQ